VKYPNRGCRAQPAQPLQLLFGPHNRIILAYLPPSEHSDYVSMTKRDGMRNVSPSEESPSPTFTKKPRQPSYTRMLLQCLVYAHRNSTLLAYDKRYMAPSMLILPRRHAGCRAQPRNSCNYFLVHIVEYSLAYLLPSEHPDFVFMTKRRGHAKCEPSVESPSPTFTKKPRQPSYTRMPTRCLVYAHQITIVLAHDKRYMAPSMLIMPQQHALDS
jgi:hypothetical protein